MWNSLRDRLRVCRFARDKTKVVGAVVSAVLLNLYLLILVSQFLAHEFRHWLQRDAKDASAFALVAFVLAFALLLSVWAFLCTQFRAKRIHFTPLVIVAFLGLCVAAVFLVFGIVEAVHILNHKQCVVCDFDDSNTPAGFVNEQKACETLEACVEKVVLILALDFLIVFVPFAFVHNPCKTAACVGGDRHSRRRSSSAHATSRLAVFVLTDEDDKPFACNYPNAPSAPPFALGPLNATALPTYDRCCASRTPLDQNVQVDTQEILT